MAFETPAIRRPITGRTYGISANGEVVLKSPAYDGTAQTGNGVRLSNYPPPLLWQHAPSPNDNDKSLFYEVFDDFLYPASATQSDVMAWTSMDDAGTGTNAFQDVSGGVYNIVTAAAQDDYHGIRSVSKSWLFVAGKPLWLEARFRVAEAATNKSAWAIGLTNTVTTGGLQTGSSGPLASYDGALIWKDEGAMTVSFETSITTTQNTLSAFATSITNTYQRVGFHFDGATTTGNITPYFHNGTSWTVGTSKTITLAGLTQMYLIATIKAGAGGGAETMQLDYIRCLALR